MRVQVARIVRDTLNNMRLAYPTLSAEETAQLADFRRQLEND
jgi:hypothetical protein